MFHYFFILRLCALIVNRIRSNYRSEGQASKIFERLRKERQLVVLKNNAPAAVILSPDEYERLTEIEEDYQLLLLAQNRISSGSMEHKISFNDALADLGITEAELNEAKDVEIE